MEQKSESNKQWPTWVKAFNVSYLGIFFGIAWLLGYAVGSFCDQKYQTYPKGIYAGLLVGTIINFYELYRVAQKHQKALAMEESQKQK